MTDLRNGDRQRRGVAEPDTPADRRPHRDRTLALVMASLFSGASGRARAQAGARSSHSRLLADAGSVRAVAVGMVVGVVSLLLPVALSWLPNGTVYAVSLAVIAAIYIGFAVADGRPHVVAVETVVASGFILIAAVALNQSAGALWLVATGLMLHGAKDLWQHRTQFVRNTRWWPPFCVAVDWTAALGLAGLVAMG